MPTLFRTKAVKRSAAGRMLLLAVMGAGLALGVQAETLRIGGTGAALGTMRLLGNEFSRANPGITIEVLPYIGSTGAIKGVHAGTIEIGLSGRTAKPNEENLDARFIPYASTPLVIAAHPSAPLTSFNRDRLAAIYSGELTRWEGGGLVRLVLRPANETDNEVLRSMSPGISRALDIALARPGMRYAATDQDAADMIERIPGAIGTSTLALVLSEKRQVQVLALDGTTPSVDMLKSGRYPFSKPLFMLTRKSPTPAVSSFVAFVLSPRGQTILNANGQLPAKP